MYDMELQPELAGRRLQVSRLALGTGKGRVEERGRDGRCRHQLVQHLHLLLHQLHAQVGHARDVAAWSVESSTSPTATGSTATEKTIGRVVVSAFAASADEDPAATIRAT